MITMAKVRPSRPSLTRSEMDFSTNGAWLKVSLMVTLPPSLVANSSSRGLMPLEIETVFPSCVLVIEIARDGLPSTLEIDVTGASS